MVVSLMYAVVEFQGHQYIVKQGDTIVVDKVNGEVDEKVTLDSVLLTFGEDQSSVSIGEPYVAGASVVVRVVSHQKAKKIRVLKFQAKKRYQRVYGHRSHESVLYIESVTV